jgi:hypothetical protein
MTINLGSEVKDLVTGFQGIAVAKTQFLNGCYRISVQPPMTKEGKVPDNETFDEPQLKLVKEGKVPEVVSHTHPEYDLGDEVIDTVTNFKGIAVARTTWLNGTTRTAIQPRMNKEGKVNEPLSANEASVKVFGKKKVVNTVQRKTGGPLSFKPTEERSPRAR